MRYLDPLALARLRNLRLRLGRAPAEGRLSGRRRASRFGFSQEFAQHREYAPGDELKFVDWKLYARKDRYFVKQFQDEASLEAYLLVDASGSMGYAGRGLASKWEHACSLAAGLAYLVLTRGDAAGLALLGARPAPASGMSAGTGREEHGPRPGSLLPPRRGFPHLRLMDAALAAAEPAGETDLRGALGRISGLLPRRSLLLLLSDLLADPEGVLDAARALKARRHGLAVVQLLDPRERDLDLEGPVLLEGLEGEAPLRCEASLLRGAYREAFSRRQRLYEAGFRSAAVPFVPLYTDAPWGDCLERCVGILG